MRKALTTLAVLVLSSSVLAHDGDRIWIDAVSGKIRTFNSSNPLTPNSLSRVFPSELQNFFDVFTTEFPGYQLRTGSSIATGTTFGFKITGPLLFFDDATDSFATTKAKFGAFSTPQMAVSLNEIRITGDGPVNGFNFFSTGAEDHAHLSYTMVADGLPVNGPAGVYALPLSLTSSGPAASDPYYIVLGKGVSMTAPLFQQAAQTVQKMLDLPGDVNLDGIVSAADLNALALNWQDPSGWWFQGDFNFDGIVNIGDLRILANNWQQSAPLGPLLTAAGLGASVPEPGMVVVAAPMLVMMLSMRRRR